MLRSANPDDYHAIVALLVSADLPTAGIAPQTNSFVVAEIDGAVVGTGGLEFCGSFALLRSLAVATSHQGRGLASAICDQLEATAATRRVHHLYLLTETAERFFERRGYRPTLRADAPVEIARTEEFSTICPASAVLMRRPV